MSFRIEGLFLPGVLLIHPKRYEDARGFFMETYRRDAFAEAGIDLDFLQDNHSLSLKRGTIRGLHYQAPPFEQSKLVRVIREASWMWPST